MAGWEPTWMNETQRNEVAPAAPLATPIAAVIESSIVEVPYLLYVALDLRSLHIPDYGHAAIPPSLWARFIGDDPAEPTAVYRLTAELWVRILSRLPALEERANDIDLKNSELAGTGTVNTYVCYLTLVDRLGILLDYVREYIDPSAIAKCEEALRKRGGRWLPLPKPKPLPRIPFDEVTCASEIEKSVEHTMVNNVAQGKRPVTPKPRVHEPTLFGATNA